MGFENSEFLENIDSCIKKLQEGSTILYPTDTVWGIGCDATNENAVKKIYRLKKREDTKALICLVSNQTMLETYVEQIPDVAYKIIDSAKKPTTIIYDGPIGVAKNLVAQDNSIAIRIATDKFCQDLINTFGRPIVSTSANISGMPTPNSFKMIHVDILKGVDYVVNLYQEKLMSTPSSIIKLSDDGTVKIIRR